MKKIFISLIICFSFFLINNLSSQWLPYYLPYGGIAYRIDFHDLNTGVSSGHTVGTFYGKIFYTTNSGTNWIQSSYPYQLRAITALQFIDASNVYACGSINYYDVSLYNSTPLTIPGYSKLNSFCKGISDVTEPYKGVFLKSTNAGMNWFTVGQMDSLTGYVEDMYFYNLNTGYAVIDTNPSGYPKFYKTTNAGTNWQFVKLIDSIFVTDDLCFINLNTGFICGHSFFDNYFKIYKTTNAGLNWNVLNFSKNTSIVEINFFNNTTGIAVGNSSGGFFGTKIYRTTNTGTTWDSVFAFPKVFCSFVKILNGTGTSFASGYYVTDTNNLYFTKTYTFKSTNYGLSWTARYFNTNNLISGCSLIDQNNYFMSGGNFFDTAVILKSTNGGNVFVNSVSSIIPDKIELSQNYPNPFNPSTIIRFRINALKLVTLKIYDVLGKEIATLVNEKLQPGIYEIPFSISQLSNYQFSSGIYLYRLKTDNFTETKKMMLIK